MSENSRSKANPDQADYWNSPSGQKWVDFQESIDDALANVMWRLLERCAPQSGEEVADIGCGTGALSLEVARRVQPGSVLGLDISDSLLAHARARQRRLGLESLTFSLGDAQTHAFEGQRYDLLLSRFGVMFFSDPSAAFANLRRALKPGGRIEMAAWSTLAENPWFSLPRKAAVERLGEPEPSDPRAPGPTAFAEVAYVEEILSSAGFQDIEVASETVILEPQAEFQEILKVICHLGPIARLMREKEGDAKDLEVITDRVAEAFSAFLHEGRLKVPARLNFLRARNG